MPPTNGSDEGVEEDFYSRLSTITQNCPRQNININAKIGSDNRGYEEIIGQQGLGEMNDNGERLADLCALSNLVIGEQRLPAQKDTQSNLAITRPVNREPDRPYMHR